MFVDDRPIYDTYVRGNWKDDNLKQMIYRLVNNRGKGENKIRYAKTFVQIKRVRKRKSKIMLLDIKQRNQGSKMSTHFDQ